MAYLLNLDTSSTTSLYGPAISTRSPVRVVATTTINLALNLVGAVIDGVTLVAGDRVLLSAQSPAVDRGIYVVAVGAGATSRSRDFESSAIVNALVYVNEGTVNARTIWWIRYDGSFVANFTRYLFPDTQGDVFLTTAATLTNKTLTAASNVLTARGLRTATTTVAVNAASPPTTGQYLTATSSTAANWQTISGGGEVNTGSSIGGGAAAFFKQKTGVNLEFNSLNISDTRLTSSIDVNDNILISVNEGAIEFGDLWSSTPIPVLQGGLGITTGTANNILRGNGTVFVMDRPFVPAAGAIAGTTDTQTFTTTNLNDNTNTIAGDAIRLALNGQFKNVRNAAAPTTGQIFTEVTTGNMGWSNPNRVITYNQSSQQLNAITTTSGTLAVMFNFFVTALPVAGNYLITWAYVVEHISGSATGTYNTDFRINGVGGYASSSFTNSTGAAFEGNGQAVCGMVRVNLAATTHQLEVLGSITGSFTLTLRSVYIEITNI